MPRVVISGQAARRFTGGLAELEVEADTFRRMVLELDPRFPGLGRQIEENMAVAIDGEIFQDAYLTQLRPEGEIYLIPKIGDGSPRTLSRLGTPFKAPEPRGRPSGPADVVHKTSSSRWHRQRLLRPEWLATSCA